MKMNKGLPFVGQAGKLLNELLAAGGFKRENVFITNVVKCRPPGNRDPKTRGTEAPARIISKNRSPQSIH